MTTFRSETFMNHYLADGATEVNAVVTVTASGSLGLAAAATAPEAIEVLIIDTSGSMAYPRTKIREARDATMAAIDCLRDGVLFAVIAGTDVARQVYPSPGNLAQASDAVRADAKRAVGKLNASGGTAMGSWLRFANQLVASHSAGLRHAILLTDGENVDESPEELAAALAECEGNFQCDCRGVGADWRPDELKQIAGTLLGDVALIRRPEDMVADFTELMSRVRDRRVPDVALRVWTPLGAQIGFVKQSLPEIADLSDRGVAVNERESDYPTGAWGDESRDYHLQICVPAHTVGERMLAGRVKLVVDGEVVSQTNIDVTWSEDEHLTTKKHKAVRDTELRQQYAELTTEMLDARHDGDIDKATERAERMRDIAQQLHDLDKVELVDRFVDVDPETGRVTPKANVDRLDELDAATRSVKTNRTKRPEVPNDPGSEP